MKAASMLIKRSKNVNTIVCGFVMRHGRRLQALAWLVAWVCECVLSVCGKALAGIGIGMGYTHNVLAGSECMCVCVVSRNVNR